MTLSIDRIFTPDDRAEQFYPTVPFDVPGGTRSITVELSFDRALGVIDIGCEGPAGWRGWSGGARQRFTIADTEATWGYLPGELETGQWNVVLGLHRVGPHGIPIELHIELSTQPVDRRAAIVPDPPAPPAIATDRASAVRSIPRSDDLTWLACDFHAHTLHSDGELSVDELAAAAAQAGLDVLAVTDHNTVAAHAQLPEATRRYGVELVPGQEITTDRGHANAFGQLPVIDFRQPGTGWQDEVLAAGGLFSINHPVAGDCSWQYPIKQQPPMAEVMHSSWLLDLDSTAIWAWMAAVGPTDTTLLAGSDFHARSSGLTPGTPTTWVAAASPSMDDVFDALRAGRTSLSMGSPMQGPLLMRDGDDLWAIEADGRVHMDPDGRQRLIHGERVRVSTAAASAGVHRLVTATGHIQAMSR